MAKAVDVQHHKFPKPPVAAVIWPICGGILY